MGLIVALGDNTKAEGELFWDDGESIGELIPPLFQADLHMLIRRHTNLLSVGYWLRASHGCKLNIGP